MKMAEKDSQNRGLFHPIELTARVHTAEQLICIFRGPVEWLQHVLRHFANRSEAAWAAVLGQASASALYSLRDNIPGSSISDKETFLENLLASCQKEDATAVSIYQQSAKAYKTVGPLIRDIVKQALDMPRYAYFERSNPLSPTESGPAAYAILDPRGAIGIIRHADLRTCYFPKGIRGRKTDLYRVQRLIFVKTKVQKHSPAGLGWTDKEGEPVYPYTEGTMGWGRLSREGVSGRVYRMPSPRTGGRR